MDEVRTDTPDCDEVRRVVDKKGLEDDNGVVADMV